jgi:hypothetical protein
VAGDPPARIISASRRTDLPGWHPDWLAARLGRLRTPVHSVFFWTRVPHAFTRPGPLRDALRAVENPVVGLTVTGLGGTPLEPRVPETAAVLAALPALLAALRDQPERLRWRFDPLLAGRHTVDGFRALCARFAALGVRSCTISLLATTSLKGDLRPQLAGAGLAPWEPAAALDFTAALAAAAADCGVRLAACATPALAPLVGSVIDRAQCIDAGLAARLHPRALSAVLPKDPRQRRACTCVVSEDLGSYVEHICHSGCAYCYSKAGGPRGAASASGV